MDNAEIKQGPNVYDYVSNNPINKTDILGLAAGKTTDFAVLGSRIQGGWGGLLQDFGIDHVDITYKGVVVYVGHGGGVKRMGSKVTDYKSRTVDPLTQESSGRLKYGPNKCCKDATDGDILKCLQLRPQTAGDNCQGDVAGAIADCCLTGWSTSVSTHFPGAFH